MRATRLERFKRLRHQGIRKILFFSVLIPAFMLAAGYIISSTVIIPAINK